MSLALPGLRSGEGHYVVVGDCGSPLARGLRSRGLDVVELLPSDFKGGDHEMFDLVAVLPDCPEPEEVGAVAAACARCIWFQEREAPPALVRLLTAAGVPVFGGGDLLAECDA